MNIHRNCFYYVCIVFWVISLFCLNAFCGGPDITGFLNDKNGDGTFVNDTYKIVIPASKDNQKFTISSLATNGLWKLDFAKKSVYSPSNMFPTVIMKIPPEKADELQNGKWKLAVMMLGNDSKWHLFYRKPVRIHFSSDGDKIAFNVISGYKIWMRGDLYGKNRNNMSLKPINDYTVYKMCILFNGEQVSKFIYSQKAEQLFMDGIDNIMSNESMENEFGVD